MNEPAMKRTGMKRIVLTHGLASGAVLAAMSGIMVPLCLKGALDFDKSEIVGYASMVLAFLLVFFGIRRYRDGEGGGRITFSRAFLVGILITLLTCAIYVVSWEIVYFGFFPDFVDQYQAHLMKKLESQGATPQAIEAAKVEMAQFKTSYANPLFNVAVTFLEIFPVGLIVTLVSAAILRRKTPPGAPATAPA